MIGLAGQPGSSDTMPIPMTNSAIADDLAERIGRGEYPPGTQLPRLAELAAMYSVSVSTVQRATDRLKERGLIVGSQGRGLFVAEPSS